MNGLIIFCLHLFIQFSPNIHLMVTLKVFLHLVNKVNFNFDTLLFCCSSHFQDSYDGSNSYDGSDIHANSTPKKEKVCKTLHLVFSIFFYSLFLIACFSVCVLI